MTEDESRNYQELLWNTLLGERNCATYDGAVDSEVLRVLGLIISKRVIYYTDIAKELNLEPNHVQLIQFLLCTADLCEYGCSPRGCWETEKGKEFFYKMLPYLEELERE